MNGQENKQTFIFADVRNAGNQASAITALSVDAIVNGTIHSGRLLSFPNSLTLHTDNKNVTYLNKDALYNKISHRIEVGDEISGIVLVSFPDVDDKYLTYGEAVIRLTVSDVKQRQTSAEQRLGKSNEHELMIYPGMDPQVH